MKTTKLSKLIALVLAAAMLLTLLPVGALAESFAFDGAAQTKAVALGSEEGESNADDEAAQKAAEEEAARKAAEEEAARQKAAEEAAQKAAEEEAAKKAAEEEAAKKAAKEEAAKKAAEKEKPETATEEIIEATEEQKQEIAATETESNLEETCAVCGKPQSKCTCCNCSLHDNTTNSAAHDPSCPHYVPPESGGTTEGEGASPQEYTVTVKFGVPDGHTAPDDQTQSGTAGAAFSWSIQLPSVSGLQPKACTQLNSDKSTYTVSFDALSKNETVTIFYEAVPSETDEKDENKDTSKNENENENNAGALQLTASPAAPKAGDTVTVTLTGLTENETVVWSSDATLTESENQVTFTVPSDAAKDTSIAVTATSTLDGARTATVTVTVVEAEPETGPEGDGAATPPADAPTAPLRITCANPLISVGGTTDISVTQGAAQSWASSNDSVATVDADGHVTGVAPGTVTISALDAFDGETYAALSVTVKGSYRISGPSNVKSGASVQLALYDASGKEVMEGVTWSSSEEAILTVDATGKVTGGTQLNSTAVITASVGDAATTHTITVVSSMAIAGDDVVAVGKSITLTVSGVAEGEAVQWTADKPDCATIDNGVVTGVSAGTVLVTATARDQHATKSVTVTDAMAISGPEQVWIGATPTYTVVGAAQGTAVMWSLGVTNLASIDSAGKLSCTYAGTVMVQATVGETVLTKLVTILSQTVTFNSNYPVGNDGEILARKFIYDGTFSVSGTRTAQVATPVQTNAVYQVESSEFTMIDAFSCLNYDFIGWNTAKDGSGAWYSAGEKVYVEGNMTLYAQWRKNGYEASSTDVVVLVTYQWKDGDADKSQSLYASGVKDASGKITFMLHLYEQITLSDAVRGKITAWTVGGKTYSVPLNGTCTFQAGTALEEKISSKDVYGVTATATVSNGEDASVYAEFYILKRSQFTTYNVNSTPIGNYYYIGQYPLSADGSSVSGNKDEMLTGGNVNRYISDFDKPSAQTIADIVGCSVEEAEGVRWYKIQKPGSGNTASSWHIDGMVYTVGLTYTIHYIVYDGNGIKTSIDTVVPDGAVFNLYTNAPKQVNGVSVNHWYCNGSQLGSDTKSTVVGSDIYVYGQTESQQAYTVEFYLKQNGAYSKVASEQRYATLSADTNISADAADKARYEGRQYTFVSQNPTGGLTTTMQTGKYGVQTCVWANGSTLKLYFDPNTYGYTVKYYKDSIAESNYLGRADGTPLTFGSQIPSGSVDKTKFVPTGYKTPGTVSGNWVISTDAAQNVLYVVYEKYANLRYTVKYYKDSTAGTLLGTESGFGAYGDTIPYTDGAYLPEGYATPGTVSGALTMTELSADNVLNVVYATKASYSYTVRYYRDTVSEGNLLGSEGYTGIFGAPMVYVPDLKRPDGYQTGELQGGNGYITADPAKNVLTVLYRKGIYAYEINFYRDTVSTATLVHYIRGNAALGTEMSTLFRNGDHVPDGYNQNGTVSGVEGNTAMVITVDSKLNVVNVVYAKRADIGYTVNYYKDSIAAANKLDGSVTGQGTLGAAIPHDDTLNAPDGYIVPGTASGVEGNTAMQITADETKNIVNVVYLPQTGIGYTVNYYRDSIDQANFLDSVLTLTGTFGTVMTYSEYASLPTGYVAPGTPSGVAGNETMVITMDDALNVVNVVYGKGQYGYTVNYYQDSIAEANKLGESVTGTGTYGEAIPCDATLRVPVGYVTPGTVSGQRIITEVAANNVLNVVYAKNANLGYTVNYYKDGVGTDNLLGSDTGTGTYGDAIPYTDGNYLPAGYVTPGTVSGQRIITEVADDNVLNVVYAKNANLGYTVNYYKDSVAEGNLLGSDNGIGTFGDDIPYTDGNYLQAGYVTPGTVSGQTTITETAANNVLNVVYARNANLGYTVNYYKDAISTDNLLGSDTETGTFGDAIPYTDGKYLDTAQGAGYVKPGTVSGQATITEVEANNVRNVVYGRNTHLGYTVKYYKDSIADGNCVRTDNNFGTLGAAIPYVKDFRPDDTYALPGTVSGQTIITAVEADNVMNVLFVKRTDMTHTVTYQYTGSLTPDGAAAQLPNGGTAEYKSTVTVAAVPSVKGYTFSGWTTSDAAISGGAFPMPDTDVLLTGSWTANPYTVSYQYDSMAPANAPTAPGAVSKDCGTADIAVEAAPTMEGYTFNGWATSDVQVTDGKFTMPANDVTFTGSWTVNKHTIRIYYYYEGTTTPVFGASYNPAAVGNASFGVAYRLNSYKMDKAGYTYTIPAEYLDGDTFRIASMPDSDVDIVVYYAANRHNVSYAYSGTVPNDAPAAPATAEAVFDTSVTVDTVVPAASVTGHVFSGWATTDASISGGAFTMPDKDVALTGSWIPNAYDVSYAYTGTVPTGAPSAPGTAKADYLSTVTVSTAVSTEPSAAVEGYTFDGWTTADAAITGGAFTMPAKNVQLTGGWTLHSNTVSYQYDGDVPGTADALPADATVEYNASVTVAAMPGAVEGFTFKGWETADAAVDADGKFTMPDKAVIVTGVWERNQHDVIYQYTGAIPTGAPVVPGTVKVPFAADVTVSTVLPTMEGYTFSGWTVATQGVDDDGDGAFTMPDTDVLITGQWTVNSHPVTYTYTGVVPEGVSAVPAAASYDFATANIAVAAEPAVMPASYSFSGWTTVDTTVSNGMFSMPDEPVQFVGSFIPDMHAVIYRYTAAAPAGAPAAPATAYHRYTGTVIVAREPSTVSSNAVTGYTFSGWTVASPASVTVSGGVFTMPDEDVILEGTFTPNPHTLTVIYRYAATGETAAPTVTYTVGYGGAFSVASPTIADYTASEAVVAGVMEDTDLTFIVEYTAAAMTHTLVIAYMYLDTGAAAAPTYRRTAVAEGTDYSVDSPAIAGYRASMAVVTGTMPNHNVKVDVYYSAVGTPPAGPTGPEPDGPEGGGTDTRTELTPLETITDDAAALAGRNRAWALLNLILAIATALTSLMMLLGFIGKKKEERELNDGTVREEKVKKHGWIRLFTLLPAIGAVVAFILTENMRLPMQWTDQYTLLMVVIALIQLCLTLLGAKERSDEDPEDTMKGHDEPGPSAV